MKRIKYLLFVILLLLSFNVKAETCESSEMTRLKELAKKVEFDYDYKIDGEEASFSINAVNLNEDLMVLIIKNYYAGDYREFKGDTKATLTGFSEGEKVVITIKAFVPNPCSGNTVTTKTIKLPYYNKYYDEEKCKGNEDFKYCKELIDRNINENEFNKQFELYLKNKEEKQKEEPEKKVEETNNLFIFIIVGIVLIIVISTFLIMSIIKRRRKNRL